MSVLVFLYLMISLADAEKGMPSDQEAQRIFRENRPLFELTIDMMKDSRRYISGNWMSDEHRERLKAVGVLGASSNVAFTEFVFTIFRKHTICSKQDDNDYRKSESIAIGFGEIDESFCIDSSDCLLCDEWEGPAIAYKLLEDGWWIVRVKDDFSVGHFVLPE